MSSAKPSLDLLRSLTDEHVLRALMERRRLTRAEVATLTGISKPTISDAVRRLADAGLLVDTGERSTGRGRAGAYYTLAPGCGGALVVDITPQGVLAEVVDAFGDVVAAAEVGLDRGAGAGGVEHALGEAVDAVVARARSRRLRTAVVSAADPVDRVTGRLVHLPDSPFLVGDLDPVALLAPVVDGPVLVDNDVNWAARAEQAAGDDAPAGGSRDFVYLYLDEGLGCAIVCDGEVRRGHSGLAGEIAHLVTTGPGGRAMQLTQVFEELGLRLAGSTAVDVGGLRSRVTAEPGDGTLDAVGVAVTGVVAAAVALSDPERVVVGGAWGRDRVVVAELSRRTAALSRPVPVVAAAVEDRPQVAGARAAALTQLRDIVVAGAGAGAPGSQ